MKHKEIVNYFTAMCEDHKEINHSEANKRFYRMNLEEALSASGSDMQEVAFVLETHDGHLEDNLSDNMRNNAELGFMVIKPCDQGDFDRETEIYDETFEIAMDVLSKIKKDRETYVKYRGFDMGSVRYHCVMKLYDGLWYGTRVILKMNFKQVMTFDETKWRIAND